LGTPLIVWYVESKTSSSNNWASLRAAAAQLLRNGVNKNAITSNIHRFLSNYPPQVKIVSGQEIPDREKNIIRL
jgi:hypothetical protein